MFPFLFSPFMFIPFLFPILIFFFVFRIGSRFFQGLGKDIEEEVQPPFDISRTMVPKRKFEGKIFNLAYRLKGRVTLSEVIVETGLAIKDAEKVIEGMLDEVHVRMEIDPNGMVIYEFPEIIARLEDQPP